MLQRVTPLALAGHSLFFLLCTFRSLHLYSFIVTVIPNRCSTPPRERFTLQKKEKPMESGTLLSHVDTDLVTREQLALVETPDATRSFKPVPHIELIDTLEHVLKLNQITIRREQFALRRDGATLFGVLQLAYQDTLDGMAALGLRTSNNRTMSIQLCAGLSVFVCDNMVFRGDLIALNRKHTSGLHLRTEINHAVLRLRITSGDSPVKSRT